MHVSSSGAPGWRGACDANKIREILHNLALLIPLSEASLSRRVSQTLRSSERVVLKSLLALPSISPRLAGVELSEAVERFPCT